MEFVLFFICLHVCVWERERKRERESIICARMLYERSSRVICFSKCHITNNDDGELNEAISHEKHHPRWTAKHYADRFTRILRRTCTISGEVKNTRSRKKFRKITFHSLTISYWQCQFDITFLFCRKIPCTLWNVLDSINHSSDTTSAALSLLKGEFILSAYSVTSQSVWNGKVEFYCPSDVDRTLFWFCLVKCNLCGWIASGILLIWSEDSLFGPFELLWFIVVVVAHWHKYSE